ncbi:[LysW]-lysine hydrolase, partial [Candidatus Sumerlaeota bacterium]|nr:[LysW]-lysine hydrolase [Candidatus Sumerlaeota bacterium]
ELLRELVSRYSPSGNERPATEFLLGVFRGWGWNARIDEVGNVIGEIGSGPPTICFLGHIDTVTGEIPVRVEDGRLYGRGAVDAKGPLAAAACAAARLPRDLDKKIIIVGAVEEESPTSRGTRHIVGRIRPDFAIVGEPSRWDRITIGYKGVFHFRYTLAAPRAHRAAETPSPATTAVNFLADILKMASRRGDTETPAFDSLTANVSTIKTRIKCLGEEVTATVDMRLPLEIEPDTVEQKVRKMAGKAFVDVIEKIPAALSDKNTSLVRALLRSIRRQGGQPRFAIKTGTSDMNIVAPIWKCPIVAYGPGDSRLDHTPNEHICLDEYQRAIAVLEATFLELRKAGKQEEKH